MSAVKTYVEQLAPDISLESRLKLDGSIELVAVIDVDSVSAKEARVGALARVRLALLNDPRPVDRVIVRLGQRASSEIEAARQRRLRRAEKHR